MEGEKKGIESKLQRRQKKRQQEDEKKCEESKRIKEDIKCMKRRVSEDIWVQKGERGE